MSERGRGAGRTCRAAAGICGDGRCWRKGAVGEAGQAGKVCAPPAPGAEGRVAPEHLLSPTRWHWEPCDGIPVPQHSLACPCPSPGAERRGSRALRSIPFPLGAECHLGAGVTQCQPSEERVIDTCPVLHMLTWPRQESWQGVWLLQNWCPDEPGGSQSLACVLPRARASLVAGECHTGSHCTAHLLLGATASQGPAGSWGVTAGLVLLGAGALLVS